MYNLSISANEKKTDFSWLLVTLEDRCLHWLDAVRGFVSDACTVTFNTAIQRHYNWNCPTCPQYKLIFKWLESSQTILINRTNYSLHLHCCSQWLGLSVGSFNCPQHWEKCLQQSHKGKVWYNLKLERWRNKTRHPLCITSLALC